jgi:hypothetical protein
MRWKINKIFAIDFLKLSKFNFTPFFFLNKKLNIKSKRYKNNMNFFFNG